MLTAMTEEDWTIVLRVFAASRSRRGDKGRNDRKFLEALHYFVVHNITWRALPEKFGHWNSVNLVQMFDSTAPSGHAVAPTITDMNSRLLIAASQTLRTRALYLHNPWLVL